MTQPPRITFDRNGTPALWAADVPRALHALGYLHAWQRGLQAFLLFEAGRGSLAGTFVPRPDLVAIDSLVHRLDIPERGRVEASRLDARAGELVDAYLAGFALGLARHGLPRELRLLAARPAPPDRASVLSGLLVSSYLGLAQGQERMERALVDAVQAGANVATLARAFAPHLDGFEPALVRDLAREPVPGFAAPGVPRVGGSNAWAVDGTRSASGTPWLAGDPHLQVNQLPAILYEVRARVGTNYWLGATIPGLPGLMVGRTRDVAWAGTFAVADNVDLWVEELARGQARRGDRLTPLVVREVEIKRRLRSPVRLRFYASDRGALERSSLEDGPALATRWAGADRVAESLGAYLGLLEARSAEEAERSLARAHSMSLHFVLADRSGVRYRQAGRIPLRSPGWSGLYPVSASRGPRWLGFREGDTLPRLGPDRGVVASANEARLAADGGVLSTLAQPGYRLERIEQLLRARELHDAQSLQAIQSDLYSLQAVRLRSRLLGELGPGALRTALAAWDCRYDVDSVGAHAFELARRAALGGLSQALGGDWLAPMLDRTELGTWWSSALDRLLEAAQTWSGESASAMREAMEAVSPAHPTRWGEVHRLELPHVVLGGLPRVLGLDRGPFELPGSVATVSQANVVPEGASTVTVAPAYRFVTDLGTDEAATALPGGVDGWFRADSYDQWLDDWRAGRYHRIAPPTDDEAVV